MPCSYYMPGEEAEIEASKLREDLDRLTHENDQLREIILRIADKDSVPVAIWTKIQDSQIEHRKEDLRRLEKTLIERLRDVDTHPTHILGLATVLQKVLTADPKLPLADQLGFDPDDF